MKNEYGLDVPYFQRLCAREFNDDVISRQTPDCLSRAFLRAAKTADARVFFEREFEDVVAVMLEEDVLELLRKMKNHLDGSIAGQKLSEQATEMIGRSVRVKKLYKDVNECQHEETCRIRLDGFCLQCGEFIND